MTASAERKPVSSARKALIAVLFVLLLAAAGAGLWYVRVTDVTKPTILPPCLLHEFTGLYCTGCGMTRALHYLLNGQWYAAFRMNPLAVVSLPFLAWFLGLLFLRMYRGRPLPSMPTWLPWTILAVILVYTVARNLPWAPFSWLAPTQVSWVR